MNFSDIWWHLAVVTWADKKGSVYCEVFIDIRDGFGWMSALIAEDNHPSSTYCDRSAISDYILENSIKKLKGKNKRLWIVEGFQTRHDDSYSLINFNKAITDFFSLRV